VRTSFAESTVKLSPMIVFSIFSVISLSIWWSPLVTSFALALRDDQYTHLFLILPVSLALIFLDWTSPEPLSLANLKAGGVLLAFAVGITAASRLGFLPVHSDEKLSLNMLALVLWWIGSFTASFGIRFSKRALFPLCFLFWIVPIPQLVLNPVVRLLQEGSVAAANLFFTVAGVPVAQEGTRITIPGLSLEVARECSSIRSSLMLVVTTMVLAQLLLRSPWRKALVIALAVPLSVVKNGLRIFVLAQLGTRVDPAFLTGKLHHQGGIIYFLLAMMLIFVALWVARLGELRTELRPDHSLGTSTS
jgi:exosortase